MICKTSDNKDLYYEVFGLKQSDECIVFLNGLTQSSMAWLLMTPFFQTRYKILVLDFIFQGQSEKSGEWRDFDQHAADVKCILDKEGIRKVNMIGLSYGSFVAQHFAVNHAAYLNKLVLISSAAHKNAYFEAIELSWERALNMGGYSLLLDIMLPSVLSEAYFLNPLIPIDKMKEVRKDLNQNSEAILKLMMATKMRKDYRKDLERVSSPTLIIQGEKDILLPVHLAEEVKAHIKNSKLIVIQKAGHTLNLEHVAEVCKHISDFIG